MTTEFLLGKQFYGSSNESIKKMAADALSTLEMPLQGMADIGGGQGEFALYLSQKWQQEIIVLDADPPRELPNIIPVECDLNDNWPIRAASLDLLVSLEVIEHLENPRHFFREIWRCLRPGGYAFISTPHNINLIARLLFVFKGQNRHFQDLSYPAHITCLLPIDLQRMANETGLNIISVHYNHLDVLPLFSTVLRIKSRHFSNSIGLFMQKPGGTG